MRTRHDDCGRASRILATIYSANASYRRSRYASDPICRAGRVPIGTAEAIRAEANEVLTKAFGSDGEEMREYPEITRGNSAGTQEGSSSLRDINALLDVVNA